MQEARIDAGVRLLVNRGTLRCHSGFALSTLVFAVWLGWPGDAMASGYAIKEQSGRLLGSAFAGAGASAHDPSVIFFNPAGISRLDGYRISASASGIFERSDFDNDASDVMPFDVPIPGSDGGNPGGAALVPAFYASAAPIDWLHLGLGVNAPWGLASEYEDQWVGRYNAIESALRSYDINPVVSLKVTPWLAFGAGARFQYIDARLTQAIDFGSILAALGAPGAAPFSADGKVDLQADDWGYGYSVGALADVGALIAPLRGTRVGISYRSYINQDLNGNAHFSGVPAPLQALAVFQNQHADANVSTPDSVDISIYHEIDDRWAVMGDVQWTNWSRFDQLRVKFDDAGVPDNVIKESWHDSWFFTLGAEYRLMKPLTLRAGVAYDEASIQDKHRTARLPGQDRYWIAAGGSYAFTRWLSADLGYAHVFVRDADIDEEVATGPITHRLDGHYESAADIVSLQLNMRF